MDVKRGRLIVIDGGDGSGKQTQSNLLHKRLLRQGHDTAMLDFPQYGKNIFAETVSAYLRGEFGKGTAINPYLASLAYAGDRWKSADMIEEGLKDGRVFVSNRYVSSNMAHQGAKIADPKARHEFLEWLRTLEFSPAGYNIPSPDLTILLDVDPKVSQGLVIARSTATGRERDGHEKNLEYQMQVVQTFREIAKTDPTWRVINCMDKKGKLIKPDVIAKKVWELVSPYLPPQFEDD